MPGKPLTPDQLRLLTSDNLVPEGAPGLAALGINPTSAEVIVPTYPPRAFATPWPPEQTARHRQRRLGDHAHAVSPLALSVLAARCASFSLKRKLPFELVLESVWDKRPEFNRAQPGQTTCPC